MNEIFAQLSNKIAFETELRGVYLPYDTILYKGQHSYSEWLKAKE